MANEKRILVYFDELVMTLAKQYSATMDTHIYSPRDIVASIQGLRPADAVEVVHGRWIRRHNETKCSRCKFIYYSNRADFNYCPNCGAKMDGGNEDV